MNRIQQRLLDLKARQEAGEPMRCPRCGEDTMNAHITRNALSRLADIYICDSCGMDEAKLAYMGMPGSLYDWAALQPEKPKSDFGAHSGEEVWQQIQERWSGKVLRLYHCLRNKELDSREIRFRAFESLPGLVQIWTEPFILHFACQEGHLMLQVKESTDGTEITASMVEKKI